MSWYRNVVWFVKGLREYTRYRGSRPRERAVPRSECGAAARRGRCSGCVCMFVGVNYFKAFRLYFRC